MVWAAPVFLLLLAGRGRLRELFAVDSRAVLTFTVSGLLLGVNWFVFVYCVIEGYVLQASLGYFINPLVNVALGMLFLGERLRAGQWFALALAAAGVTLLATTTGAFPLLSLALAFSFGSYGLVRKTARADALLGSNLETALLFLPALAYLILASPPNGTIAWSAADDPTRALLVLSGVVTALPLLWFSNAARRLPYSTIGFFQYIAPTLQFLLAVVVFGEPFTRVELRSFLLIWLAIAVFVSEDRLQGRRRAMAPQA